MPANSHSSLQLTGKESEILWILWHADTPLTASEIVKTQEGLSINTVQAVLRTLLKNRFIEVADIVYSGTVLCRSYRTTPTAAQYSIDSFAKQYKSLAKKIPPTSLYAALVQSEANEDEAIRVLEAILEEKKRSATKE